MGKFSFFPFGKEGKRPATAYCGTVLM
jgi:hypothetical protein